MALLTLKDIHKHFAEKHLLRGVSLTINEGDRIGLVGPNGAGKTTLLRILAGLEHFEEGKRTTQRALRTAYLEQEPVIPADLTIREAVAAGAEDAAPHRVESLIDRTGLSDPDALCGTLSGGEARRVALARVLVSEPELLLLDEPTNHLDAFVSAWLEDFLIAARIPLVMVTHDRYFLDRVAQRIIELDRGVLHPYKGGYFEFLRLRAARLTSERKGETTRVNLLRRETEWMMRSPHGRTTRSKARVQRFDALHDAKPANTPGELQLEIPPGPRLGRKVVHLEGVAKSYGERCIFEGLDLDLQAGECIGVVGPNGAGKTTLLHICLGRLEPDAGKVQIGETVRFGFINQTRADLDPNKTLVREVAGEDGSTVKIGDRRVRVEGFLEKFLFPRAVLRQPIRDLSGGERNRVLLAKLLLQGANVLVLDEPTNDLDLETLRVLEEALIAFQGTVIVVSHDRFFLDRVASRVIYLDGNGGCRLHPGDMSSLIELLKQKPKREPRKKKDTRTRPAGPRRLTYKEQQELAGLPESIAAAETELASLDKALGDPALYETPDARVKEVAANRLTAADLVDTLYHRWEELEAVREAQ